MYVEADRELPHREHTATLEQDEDPVLGQADVVAHLGE